MICWATAMQQDTIWIFSRKSRKRWAPCPDRRRWHCRERVDIFRLGQTGDAIDDLYRAVGGPGKVQDTVVISGVGLNWCPSCDELERYERAAGIAHAAGAQYIEGLALREYGLQLLLAGRHTQAVAVLEQGLEPCLARQVISLEVSFSMCHPF